MALSGVNSTGLNFTGLATGIDTAKIIEGLNTFSQQRIDRLKVKQGDIAVRQTAFNALRSALFDLQSKTSALARSVGGAFDARTAVTSDSTAATAVAGSTAVPGTYSFTVASLARGAQVASTGFDDPNVRLRTGTVTLQVGGGAAQTVTITDQNNTLQGLADAINAGGGDVRASVVRESSGATPNRLLLTSSKTGAANTINITNNLTGGTGAAIDLGASTVQAASDATVTLGSGGLTVSSATNQVNNLIPGVTVNLLKADPAKEVTVEVKADTAGTVKAVQDFVDSFNAVRNFIREQTRFDPTGQTSGTLLGNRDVQTINSELSAALTAAVPGLASGANRLSSVGLAFEDDGTLSFDPATLEAALSGTSGVAPAELKRLFATTGTSSSPAVEFVSASSRTKPSSTPFTVQVTAPATRAVVVSAGPPAVVNLNPANPVLQLRLNGLAATVSLPAGPYTSVEQLLAAVQKAINTAPTLNGNLVTAELNGDGRAQISTQNFGSGANIAITGGTPEVLAALGFAGTESDTGSDVAGSFLVNGQTEAATGSGQVLTGASSNATTSGLQVRATGTAAGSATLTVTEGLASRLNSVLNRFLDPINGRLKSIDDTFAQQSADLDETIAKQNELIEAKTAQLQIQFAAMESAVNNLKGLQNQLATLTIPSNRDR